VTTPGGKGRFDGYDVLSVANHWDAVTTGVVLRRLGPPAPLRFFTEGEGATARALLDRLLDQDPDDGSPYVDVLADIDSRLALDVTDGWHHADMARDGQAWRDSLQHLDADSGLCFDGEFATLSRTEQMAVVQGVQDVLDGEWHGLPARHVWGLWTRYACAAFYAHPWAWNEIGFGGPAYPRGYKNIGLDRREPWERPERDAADPVPWSKRTEAARKAHLDQLGVPAPAFVR
jgi:hypothetical protein